MKKKRKPVGVNYARLQEKAQATYTEYLRIYKENNPDYDLTQVDPELHFWDPATEDTMNGEPLSKKGLCLGICHKPKTHKQTAENGYRFSVTICNVVLLNECAMKHTIIHELVHGLGGIHRHAQKFYDFEVQLKKMMFPDDPYLKAGGYLLAPPETLAVLETKKRDPKCFQKICSFYERDQLIKRGWIQDRASS